MYVYVYLKIYQPFKIEGEMLKGLLEKEKEKEWGEEEEVERGRKGGEEGKKTEEHS